MRYENFNPKIHDVFKVAKLVYDVDFRTYDLLFKNPNKALEAIAATAPDEQMDILHPDSGIKIATLYTADFKALVSNVLKKIIEEPIKLSQAFVDAWTKVMKIVPPENLSNEDLQELIDRILN